jgi:hydrogenase maturation protease
MTGNANGSILIAGIGNIFLGDDAFGVEVAQRLAKRALPPNVRVRDFGIRSYDLAYALMEPWDLVILVDAVPRGGKPGTVYLIEPDLKQLMEAPADSALDPHSMDPVAVLQLAKNLGGETGRIMLVGCEPAAVEAEDGQTGLSKPVQAAVEEAIRLIEELISGVDKQKAA